MNSLVQGDLPTHHLLPNDDYVLTIRQAPERAKVAGTKEKDRKPVDPPPIIQLQIRDATDPAHNYLQSPYYFMCCNLSDVNQDPRSPIGSHHLSSSQQQQVLAGTLVSSLHRLKDIDNTDGGFFVFGDVSVKMEGEYRLRFSLFEMVRERQEVMYIKSVMSEPFTVYPSRSFPGMNESTFLSRSFGDQGVRLRIRKEPRTLLKRPAPSTLRQDDYHRSYVHQPPPLESRGIPHQGLNLINRGIPSQHLDMNSRGIPAQPLELASRGITSQGLDLNSRVLPSHPAQPLELNGRGHPPQGLDLSNLSSRLQYSTQEEEEAHGNKRQRTSIDASGGTMYGEGPPSRFTDRSIAGDHRNAYHHGSERSFEEGRGYPAITAGAPERPHYDDHRSSYTAPRAQLPVPQPQTLPALYPNTIRSLTLPENSSQYEQDLRYNERPYDDSRSSNYATRNGPNPAHGTVHRQFGGHGLHSYQPPSDPEMNNVQRKTAEREEDKAVGRGDVEEKERKDEGD